MMQLTLLSELFLLRGLARVERCAVVVRPAWRRVLPAASRGGARPAAHPKKAIRSTAWSASDADEQTARTAKGARRRHPRWRRRATSSTGSGASRRLLEADDPRARRRLGIDTRRASARRCCAAGSCRRAARAGVAGAAPRSHLHLVQAQARAAARRTSPSPRASTSFPAPTTKAGPAPLTGVRRRIVTSYVGRDGRLQGSSTSACCPSTSTCSPQYAWGRASRIS